MVSRLDFVFLWSSSKKNICNSFPHSAVCPRNPLMLKLLKVTQPPGQTRPSKSPKSWVAQKKEKRYKFLNRFCELTVRLLSACTLGLHLQNLQRETISRRCFTTFCTVEKRNVKNKRSTSESFVQFFLGLSGKPKEVLRPVLKLFIHFSLTSPHQEYIRRDFFEFFL